MTLILTRTLSRTPILTVTPTLIVTLPYAHHPLLSPGYDRTPNPGPTPTRNPGLNPDLNPCPRWDPALVDPICEGNIARYDANTTLFVNPAMRYSRSNLTLRLSTDSGSSWSRSVQLADIYALSDYTSIVHGPLLRGSSATIGVLWGSCTAPLPYRVWCLEDVVLGKLDPRAQWTVLFSRVPESSLLSAS